MKIGLVGLGKMGQGIASKLLDEHEVVVWNRTPQSAEKLRIKNHELRIAKSIEDLVRQLDAPRVVWIMVPHLAVEEILTEIRKFIEAGDIVIDGGNSNYKDTDKRFVDFEKIGVKFLGVGVSGGIIAAKKGYPLMAGGSREGYDHLKPIFDSLSDPDGGYGYFGTGGAGHFVKMIHNGIEYGMMQSIGEGFDVLANSKYKFDLDKIANLWQKGTIVSGHLIDLAAQALEKDSSLDSFAGPVARSGEGDWTLVAAREEGLSLPATETAVEYRKKSETDQEIQNSFTARVLNALRAGFGGHPIKK